LPRHSTALPRKRICANESQIRFQKKELVSLYLVLARDTPFPRFLPSAGPEEKLAGPVQDRSKAWPSAGPVKKLVQNLSVGRTGSNLE
jgi:hypothetical protein